MDTKVCDTWDEVRQAIASLRDRQPTYWRGQAQSDWPLASSFERMMLSTFGGWVPGEPLAHPDCGRGVRDSGPLVSPEVYRGMRDRYLIQFRAAASGTRGTHPAPLTEDEWWALGRHYGLITPLLDWSESPYLAAFFAIAEMWQSMSSAGGVSFRGKQCVLYGLYHNHELDAASADGLRVVRVTVEELGRLHGQKGLFTWLDSERYLELRSFLDDTGRGHLLTKIVINDPAIREGLTDLQEHGVDYRTLFPDLQGAALHANWVNDPHLTRNA